MLRSQNHSNQQFCPEILSQVFCCSLKRLSARRGLLIWVPLASGSRCVCCLGSFGTHPGGCQNPSSSQFQESLLSWCVLGRILVSSARKPVSYINLAKRFLSEHGEVQLSALGIAIAPAVTVAEILKSRGLAVERRIVTGLETLVDDNRS